jgi:hypothetical protein
MRRLDAGESPASVAEVMKVNVKTLRDWVRRKRGAAPAAPGAAPAPSAKPATGGAAAFMAVPVAPAASGTPPPAPGAAPSPFPEVSTEEIVAAMNGFVEDGCRGIVTGMAIKGDVNPPVAALSLTPEEDERLTRLGPFAVRALGPSVGRWAGPLFAVLYGLTALTCVGTRFILMASLIREKEKANRDTQRTRDESGAAGPAGPSGDASGARAEPEPAPGTDHDGPAVFDKRAKSGAR